MQLDTLAVKNFQCFGPEGVAVDMADPVTAFIGMNGAGKNRRLPGSQSDVWHWKRHTNP